MIEIKAPADQPVIMVRGVTDGGLRDGAGRGTKDELAAATAADKVVVFRPAAQEGVRSMMHDMEGLGWGMGLGMGLVGTLVLVLLVLGVAALAKYLMSGRK